jgi:ketosteroid isomerase-like protein
VPPENVELLHEFFGAWNRGDLDWVLEHLTPDFEYRTAQAFPGIDPVYRGREGWTKFWKTFRDPWESISADVERVEDLGDRVLAIHVFHGKGKESGVEVTLRYANIVSFRDGLVSLAVGYGEDSAAALEAAGLS